MNLGAVRHLRGWLFVGLLLIGAGPFAVAPAPAQELGGAGTVQGTIKDPVGGLMAALDVVLSNPVTGFRRTTQTDPAGRYVFHNLPPNRYQVKAAAPGFEPLTRDVDVRSAVPIELNLTLALAGASAAVSVVGRSALVELDPTAHTDIDQSLINRLPIDAMAGLNQVVMMASPGVVADSNSFFHPIGDHAQTQFSIDNQPVTDQQSRVYSNQLPSDAVQSMEVITGVAPAEYGDKSSLVVHILTKSGLGQRKPAGSLSFGYGAFKSPSVEANVGAGSQTVGNFLSVSGLSTERFLDPPEFVAAHDRGTKQSLFDRLDLRPKGGGALHLNVSVGRSSFDVPTTLDRAGPDTASEHQYVQRRPGLLGRVEFTQRADGERLRPARQGDLPAERGPVRGSAGHRLARSPVDESRHQGRSGPRHPSSQRQTGEHDQRDTAQRTLHTRLHGPGVQLAVPGRLRHSGRRSWR